jgi:hypothetical protein
MNEHLKTIRSVVTQLEAIQQDIGKSQLELLQVLTDETQDDWDCPAQTGLLQLEIVQRTIGEIQTLLVEVMPVCEPSSGVGHVMDSGLISSPSGTVASVAVAQTPAPIRTPQELLEARGIKAKEPTPLNGLDASADRASLLLGEKFPEVEAFYKAIKRRVNNNSGSRWFSIAEFPEAMRKEMFDFGNRLHAAGFFSDFKPFSKGVVHDGARRPMILFEPLPDKRVKYFFEGGWLERYAFQIVKQQIQQATGIWCEEQFARGVKVEFPDGRHGEFDVLVSLPGDKLLWLECKTGRWQDYTERFNKLNKKYLKIPREQTALVLVKAPDETDKASASELTGMTVIHFSELREWLKKAIAYASFNSLEST